MIVLRSKESGFCAGAEKTIENAVNVLLWAKNSKLPAYSIGELIHNPNVVESFRKQGLKMIKDPEVEPGIALVRAHGLPREEKELFKTKGFTLVDATCPKISSTEDLIIKAYNEGHSIVIVGKKEHAEVKTLLGSCPEAVAVSSLEEVSLVCSRFLAGTEIAVAVQTTFSEYLYNEIRLEISKYPLKVKYLNRLCSVCLSRKKEALLLAENCDAVLVVGGLMSSNTVELSNFISQSGTPSFVVENVDGLNFDLLNELKKYKIIGVCSGTSTPSVVFEAVCDYIESI